MNKTKWILGFVAVTGLTAIPATTRAQTLLEKIAISVLADQFGIDTREVNIFQQRASLSAYDLAPYYEGAHYFKRSPGTIWQLRQDGLGWGQIAQKIGMHPGTFNRLRKQGAFDRDRFWERSYQERFGVNTNQIEVVRRSGGTLEEVLASIVVGKLTKRDPARVYDEYKSAGSWETIARESHVRLEDWKRVSSPARTKMKLTSSKSAAGKVTGKGNSGKVGGKSKGGEKSKAKSGARGKGKGGGRRA